MYFSVLKKNWIFYLNYIPEIVTVLFCYVYMFLSKSKDTFVLKLEVFFSSILLLQGILVSLSATVELRI